MKNKDRSGYTLLELVLITSICAVIATMAIPAYNNIIKSAEKLSCSENTKAAYMASFKYFSEHGEFPNTGDQLIKSGLIDKWPQCPGGGEYKYDRDTGNIECSLNEHKHVK